MQFAGVFLTKHKIKNGNNPTILVHPPSPHDHHDENEGCHLPNAAHQLTQSFQSSVPALCLPLATRIVFTHVISASDAIHAICKCSVHCFIKRKGSQIVQGTSRFVFDSTYLQPLFINLATFLPICNFPLPHSLFDNLPPHVMVKRR